MNSTWEIQNEAAKDLVKDYIEYRDYNNFGRDIKEQSYIMFFAMDIFEKLCRNYDNSPLELLTDYHEKMFEFSLANPNTETFFSVGLRVIDDILDQLM